MVKGREHLGQSKTHIRGIRAKRTQRKINNHELTASTSRHLTNVRVQASHCNQAGIHSRVFPDPLLN